MTLHTVVLRARMALRSFIRTVFSVGALVAYLILGGTGCAFFGVMMLQGLAWGLITIASIMFVLALILLRGASTGASNG